MNKQNKITTLLLLTLAATCIGTLYHLNQTQQHLEYATWQIGEVVDVWTTDTHARNGTLARRVIGIVFYDDTVMYYEVYPDVIYLGRVFLLE